MSYPKPRHFGSCACFLSCSAINSSPVCQQLFPTRYIRRARYVTAIRGADISQLGASLWHVCPIAAMLVFRVSRSVSQNVYQLLSLVPLTPGPHPQPGDRMEGTPPGPFSGLVLSLGGTRLSTASWFAKMRLCLQQT